MSAPGNNRSKAKEEPTHSRLSEDRENVLLDIAAEVFFEHGYAAASVGEMALRAKASKGTFYSRYSSKELLFEAVVRQQTDQAFEAFQALFRENAKPGATLHAFAHHLFDVVLGANAVALIRLLYMESKHFPELGLLFQEYGYGRIVDSLVNYLRGQVRDGNLRIEHIQIAAEQFIDGLIGEPTRRLALSVGELPTAREKELRVRVAVRSFLASFASRDVPQ